MNKLYLVYHPTVKHYAQVCEQCLEQFTSTGYIHTVVSKEDTRSRSKECEMCLGLTRSKG